MNRRTRSETRYEDVRAAARRSPLLEGTGEKALEELASLATCHDYPRNNVLFYQGDAAGPIFLVVSGAVKVALSNEEGKEVIVAVLQPGDLVGLVPALDGGPQPANAITISQSRLAKVGGEAFVAWMQRHGLPQRALNRELGQCVRQAYQRIAEHALLGVKERLLSTLLEIAEREGSSEPGSEVIVFTRPTHQELAERIGSSREVVSRMLKELLESDLLQAEGRVIRVPESALILRED